MANILLNISNFDEPWAYATMEQYLHPDTKVLILPLSYDEGWITDREEWYDRYGRGQEHYEELVRPFRAFGIPDEQIHWVNYYEDDPATYELLTEQLEQEHELELANVNSWEQELELEKNNLETQLNEISTFESTWTKMLQTNIKGDFSYGGVQQ